MSIAAPQSQQTDSGANLAGIGQAMPVKAAGRRAAPWGGSDRGAGCGRFEKGIKKTCNPSGRQVFFIQQVPV